MLEDFEQKALVLQATCLAWTPKTRRKKRPGRVGAWKGGKSRMNWDFGKKTKDRSRIEIELQETFDYVRDLEKKLQKIEDLVDTIYFKAQTNRALLFTSRDDEEKME